MAWTELRFWSPTLGIHVAMNVIIPERVAPPWPTFTLLHGLSDDHTIWHRRTRIEVYAESHPFLIVMPNGFRGFYTNNADGPDYLKYIVEDVRGVVERTFNVRRERSARAIGGLSMGGYGALRVGLARPDVYGSINSHSGALMYANWGAARQSSLKEPEYSRIFGERGEDTDHDLLVLSRRCLENKTLPATLIDCGSEDFLIGQNRFFVDALQGMKYPHTYREFPGEHDWNYWDTHIQEALTFHREALGV
jgi:S-formylglutathione hydrolase FrmB